jgi:diketogulonate reductase-like aldo/keto reductase
MFAAATTTTLNNGVKIPRIGKPSTCVFVTKDTDVEVAYGCGPDNDDYSPEGLRKTKDTILEAIKVLGGKFWLKVYESWLCSQAGYRHFDDALAYGMSFCSFIDLKHLKHSVGTEGVLGEAIQESGVPRSEFFITTKLPWGCTKNESYYMIETIPLSMPYHGRVDEALDISLQALKTDYIDLVCLRVPWFMNEWMLNIEPSYRLFST